MQIFFYDQKAQVSLSMGTNCPASASRKYKKNIRKTQKKRDKDDMQLGREMMIRSPWDTSSGGRNAEERKPKEKSRRPPRSSASAVSTLQSSVPGSLLAGQSRRLSALCRIMP